MNYDPYARVTSRNLAHIALICFISILLLQSAIGLFLPLNEGMDSIDVVFRTTISSIFGYLMSSIGHLTGQKKTNSPQPRTIGFSRQGEISSALDSETPAPSETVSPPKNLMRDYPQLQTIVIACLGFFCLSVLIFLRYVESTVSSSSSYIATIAQYRDIISGSTGALIGLARGHQS